MRFGFASNDFVNFGDTIIPGGCGYYRCLLPMTALPPGTAAFGPPAWVGGRGFGIRTSEKESVFGFDTVVLKQVMERWAPFQIKQAQKLGQRIIVDMDDAYDFLDDANIAKQTTDPETNKIANRNFMREVIMLADIVTVSTPFLLEYYSGLRDNVFMVRNAIGPAKFTKRKVLNRKPVIGWMGALQWRSNDLHVFRDWLGDFLIEHDLMFHHAGDVNNSGGFAKEAGIPLDRLVTSPMIPINKYQEMIQHFDIGVVPLSNIPFNEAKSYLKGLEYAASNVPFVASDLPEYRLLSEQGVGRVAATPEHWVQHLTELLDYNIRKAEAGRQRGVVLDKFTIENSAPDWRRVWSGSPNTSIVSERVQYVQLGKN